MPVKNLHDHANMLVTLLNYIFNFILTNALNLFQTLLKRAAYFNSWCNKNPKLENPAIPPIPWALHRSFSHCWGLYPELPFLLWIANYLDEEDNKKISVCTVAFQGIHSVYMGRAVFCSYCAFCPVGSLVSLDVS